MGIVTKNALRGCRGRTQFTYHLAEWRYYLLVQTPVQPGPVELAPCSFGQSSKVSYLQMLTAVCAVVNGGNLMQPYVVQKIQASDGTVL